MGVTVGLWLLELWLLEPGVGMVETDVMRCLATLAMASYRDWWLLELECRWIEQGYLAIL